jgi:HK97 family phage major capsid protein
LSGFVNREKKMNTNIAEIGLTEQEIEKFSFLKIYESQIKNDPEIAAHEREISKAVASKIGQAPRGYFVPMDVLSYPKRDMTVGTDTAGGYLVQTDLLAANFIELLRNRMMTVRMGVQVLSNLVGDVAIPKLSAGAQAYWIAEGGAPTETSPTFAQVGMSPKTVAAYTDLSRRLILQASVSAEQFVRNDLAKVLAVAKDYAVLNGTGVDNEPLGILNTPGIGSVVGGTNGAAPDWANIVSLESAVSAQNADVGSMGYMVNSKTRAKLKQTEKSSNTAKFIWETGESKEPGIGEVNGYKAGVSNQLPSDLDKGTSTGVCSAIIFGDWSSCIVGEWAALDLLVDPFTGSSSGTVRVVAFSDCDVAIRHPESFAAMKDALTA